MDLQSQVSSGNFMCVTCRVVGLVTAIIVLSKLFRGSNLNAFPTVGSTTWLGSWWAGLKFVTNARNIIQEGYKKHNSTPFKIAELYHWTIILSGRGYLEELARASDDEFSFLEAVDDQVQVRYTMGREIIDNPYHITVVRSQLTRNIQALYSEIRDEVVTAFGEVLDLDGNEWKCVPALHVLERVVCRTSNRLFVGLPLCRDPDWIDINLRYTVDAIKGGVIVGLFPTFMRPLAARFLTDVPRNIARGVELLGPIIEERRKYMNEYGMEWDDKPSDLLSWLMEEAMGEELTAERLTNRILVVNFAAIHSSSNFLTQALLYLAANPQYIEPLRKEVEDIVGKYGWSKAALGKMRKIDSFLTECHRMEGLNIVTLSRKALKDFTFSDGTFIPKGATVGAATLSLHHDGDIYGNPEVFEPFRFADMREEDGMSLKYQFASTTTEYLPFGHGKHACPGRFFAANELKSMLAHIVVTYDVKLEDNTTCPKSLHLGTFITVDPHAKIMFRNRVI